jgi:CRISPR-associated protein Csb1
MTEIQPLTNETINSWIDDKGPVALTLKQKLLPIDGEGGIIFPPTYANIGYSIDILSDGTKVAQIDSVPSQANRIEPLFKEDKYKKLVPQIEFDLGKDSEGQDRVVSLLDLAHRGGDAVVRSSDLAVKMDGAFKALLRKHDAEPLAAIAPTSLLFGVWDSRGTQVKRPRLVRSFIRAENIDVLHGAAQYNSIWKLLDDQQKKTLADEAKAKKVKLSDKGFNDVPAVFRKTDKIPEFKDGRPNDEARVLGGVIAHGPITRQVTVNLIALRSLCGADNDNDATQRLQRYLLGLALIAATADMELYLREGCLLKHEGNTDESWEVIPRRGKSQFFNLATEENRKIIEEYATYAAQTFHAVNPKEDKTYKFDIGKAKALLAKKDESESDAGE